MAGQVNKFKENDLVRIKDFEDMGVYRIESVMLMLSSNKDTLEYFYNLQDRLLSAREDELIPAEPQKEDKLQAFVELKKGTIVKLKEYDDKGIVIDTQTWGDDMTAVIAWEDGDITIEQCLEDFEVIGDIKSDMIVGDVRNMVRDRLDLERLM